MYLTVLADAIATIAAAYPEFIGSAAKVALFLIAIIGEDNLQRPPNNIRRFLASKPMKKELAKRNIELFIDADKRIVIRRKLI